MTTNSAILLSSITLTFLTASPSPKLEGFAGKNGSENCLFPAMQLRSRGMNESHMQTVVDLVDKVLMNIDNESVINSVAGDVHEFMKQFPLYPELG